MLTHHQLLESQRELQHKATHDALTGLHNRVAIIRILERELCRAQRHGTRLGVIMADIDHFKSVNDTAGHAVGDAALRAVASEIAAGLRLYDAVGRYGDEEFLIVAPGCGLDQTWELAERTRSSVAACPISSAGIAFKVSVSMGIATASDGCSVESLLQAADSSLYQAKHLGRNRVEAKQSCAGEEHFRRASSGRSHPVTNHSTTSDSSAESAQEPFSKSMVVFG